MIRRTEVAAQDRTAVLVVRAWIEETFGEGQLRARITQTLDVASGTKLETAAGSHEEVLRAVEEWLRSFVGPHRREQEDGGERPPRRSSGW